MSRAIFNLAVDLLAAALLLGMALTGLVLGFVLPPGTNRSLSLWDLTRHQWGTIHLWISFVLLLVLLLHVCLHWQWVVSTVGKRLGLTPSKGHLLRTGLPAMVGLVASVALFGWAARSGVQEIAAPERFQVCPEIAPDHTAEKQGGPVSFRKDVYPILERACLSCHGPKRQAAGFRVDRREDFFGGSGLPRQIVPRDSARSPLIAIVSGQRTNMARADAHRLADKDVALLRAWIDAGAEWPEPHEK